jgi:hypothetical protein
LTVSNIAKTCSPGLAAIMDDDSTGGCNEGGDDKDLNLDGLIWVHPHMPKCVRPAPLLPLGFIHDNVSSPSTSSLLHPPPPSFDFKSVLDHLCSLVNAVQDLSHPVTLVDLTIDPLPPTTLLSALPPDRLVKLFHHLDSVLPAVCPC